jgi:S1-C subfamily serine protease
VKILPLSDAGFAGGRPAISPALSAVPAEDEALLDAYSRAVIDVVDRVGPAVVGLSVRSTSTQTASGRGGRPQGGSGSGVIVAPDGLI